MKRYRRRLPHWDIPEAPVFVTWRLCGSLPQERSFLPEHLTSGEAFVALDRLLDSARMGPVYWRQDKIAGIVRDHLQGFKQIRHYIELSPVKDGLVAHPAEFSWSGAGGRESGSEDPRGLKSALR